jgi:histidyl-tRNA synthetase
MKIAQFAQVKAVRGMNDILPVSTALWQKIEKSIIQIFQQYAYHEIRMPVLEKTELFQRGIGEVTDIVEKEMYTFLDRNQESLTLRPEGTAVCVRAAIEHGLLYHQTQKLWYMGPMFRHERPQKGRYRQFYHIGAEAFGFSRYHIEAEMILMVTRCFEALNLSEKISLQLNSLGSVQARLQFREKFVLFCEQHVDKLDEDSQKRLKTNPLRILDSKNPEVKILLQEAPKLSDYLEDASRKEFEQLCQLLSDLNIKFDINPHLVRGLDYYTGIVFEWITPYLGAQSTVCAGGRYDNLVEELGGSPTPACGFAMGMERLVELYAECHAVTAINPPIDGYFIVDENGFDKAVKCAEEIKNNLESVSLDLNFSGGGFKSQFKRADKSQAHFALILGEDELAQNMITFKDLRQGKPQITLSLPDLIQHLRHFLRSLP